MKVYKFLLAFVMVVSTASQAYAQSSQIETPKNEASQISIKNTEKADEASLEFPPTNIKGGAGYVSFDNSNASKWDNGFGLSLTAEMGKESRKLETGINFLRSNENFLTLPMLAKFELKNFNGLRPNIKAGMAAGYVVGGDSKNRTPYDVLAEFGVGLEGRMDQKSNWFVDVMAFRGMLDAKAGKGSDYRQGILLNAGLTFKAL